MPISIFYKLHSFTSEDYRKYIETHTHIKIFKAGEYIKWSGEAKKSIYFVARGFIETYIFDKNDRKNILHFTWENQICNSTYATYLTESPEDFINCVEYTEIIQFSLDTVLYLINNFEEAATFFNTMILEDSIRKNTKIRLMQIGDKAERVYQFQKAFKNYISRISLDKQAAYLSMDRSTFSVAQKDNLKRK